MRVRTTSRLATLVLLFACGSLGATRDVLAQAPPVPTGLYGSAVSCSRIDLAWDLPADALATVQGYRVYRNGYYVAFVTSSATVQNTLASASTYVFSVSAVDGIGNESARSAAVAITTPLCADRTAPITPAGLTAVSTGSCSRIDLGWMPAVDVGGAGLRAYRVYRNGLFAMEVPAPSTLASDVGLAALTTYSYSVSAIDKTGNESARSFTANATTSGCVAGAPAAPDVSAAVLGCNLVAVSWSSPAQPGATDPFLYQVYRNGLFFAQFAASVTTMSDFVASESTVYSYTVVALDARGTRSDESAPAVVQTPACADTTPPTTPSLLIASACDRVLLGWTPSTDSGGSGLKAYRVYRDGAFLQRVLAPNTTAGDLGLSPSTRYSYTVEAVDNAGNRSGQSNVAVATTSACANRSPVADAGPDRAARTFAAVAFSGAASSDPDGSITSWAWNFGDGTTAAGVSVSHAYARAGTYAVTLTVTDDDGQAASDSAIVHVSGGAPVANAGPDRSVTSGDAIRFDGSASSDLDGTINTYAWSFGDGGTAAGVVPTHAFARPGTYSVTLTVTDDSGLTASDSATVQVVNRVPTASAGPDRQAAVTDAVVFDGRGSSDFDGTILAYTWTFGDGQSASGATVQHTYGAPGTYVVSLTVNDNLGATGNDQAVITVTGQVGASPKPWAKQIGGSGYDEARGVAVDGNDNVFVTGQATGPFDLGGVVCEDSIFLAKYAPSGALLWGKCFGGDSGGGSGRAVGTDLSGNVYMTGYFRGAVDLGGAVLTSPDGYDSFVAKYSGKGQLLWWRQFGAPLPGAIVTESGNGLAVDSDGSVVVTGAFETPTDFGGGPVASNGQTDVFIVKYGPAGQYVWSRRVGGAYADIGNGVALNARGDVIVTGTFFGPVDFGTGPLPSGAFDGFLAVYTASGVPLWSQHFGGTLSDEGKAVAVDNGGNILVTGTFTNTADLGGGPLVSAGGNDAFLVKYSPTGQHLWSMRMGGISSYDGGTGIAVDDRGQVAVTGFFSRDVDFGGLQLTSAGSKDAFVARYSPLGGLLSAQRFGGPSIDEGMAVAIDSSGAVIVAGGFLGTADLGAGSTTSAGESDAFLLRLVP